MYKILLCLLFFGVIVFSGCSPNLNTRDSSKDLKISEMRAHNIPIRLIQYRDIFADEPARGEDWKIVIFQKDVGFRNGNIVLVKEDFYYVDGDTLMHICKVSNQQHTNERVIPYLQSEIDRATLLE